MDLKITLLINEKSYLHIDYLIVKKMKDPSR
jgi:hypothetical protein